MSGFLYLFSTTCLFFLKLIHIRSFRVKEKEEKGENEQSPNTSVSSMSPLSDRSEPAAAAAGPPGAPPHAQHVSHAQHAPHAPHAQHAQHATHAQPPHVQQTLLPAEAARHLNTLSHRGYGAPVSTWNGTHSTLSRQVSYYILPI